MARGRVGTVTDGKWRIDRRIAKGGMASVYAASHTATGFRVAIKILSRDATEHDEARARFLREGKLANAVDHEGVIDIIDDGITADGRPFLIMELLEGETLEEKRARSEGGRLGVADVAKVSLAIADVLAAAHDAGLVHRDVKPLNVFLTTSGVVKLLDFGVAGKRMQSEECTMTGAGCGTPLFMAPEQITGDAPIDARADVFALGATMYRLLSGRFPFPGDNLVQYLHLLLSAGPPKRLDAFVPGVDAALADVVERALAREPEKRFPDARTMASAIA
jgi:serine/threonine-protein kinase